MSRPFVLLCTARQLAQQGEGGCLIQRARTTTNDTRRSACLFGDDVSAHADQHDNCS